MSRTIDEKVVEMRFDNQNFEKNVSQSMSTLDKLKSALDFSGVDKTFSGLTDAANKLNLGSVGDAIEGVGNKFSWLETVATGALLNIGASIETYLASQLKGLTLDNITAGFDKYADKTKAVQTIMNATGKEIEEVSSQLDRLNWYTDETSYDFTEMVASIGKFTSAGIELETAVTAMEGIANWAGISGAGKQEANRAMYNISQALSGGYMRLEDWKSIDNANMATKEFKEMAIEAAKAIGTLEEYEGMLGVVQNGEVVFDDEWANGVNYQNFAKTLTKGQWFTNDVLTLVLEKYGKFTDRLSQIYEEWNSNPEIDITTSQIIKLANQYKDGSIDMEQAMAMTGQTAEALIPILEELASDEYDLGRRALAAAQEARTFQDAIDATKDAVSTQWMNTFEILFGNYEEAKVLWTDLSNEMWEIFAGPLSDMNDMLTAWKGLDVGGREDFIEGIKNIYRAIRSVVDPISEAWDEIFPALTFQRLGEIVAGFKNFTESLILSEEQMSAVSSAFQGIFGIMKIVGDGAKELAGTYLSRYFSGFDGFTDAVFQNIRNIGSYLDDLIHILPRMKSAREAFAEGQVEALGYIQKWEKTEAFVQKLSDIFDKLKTSAGILGDLGAKFLNFRDSINAFYNEGGGLAGFLEVAVRQIANVVSAVEELIHLWTGVDIAKWIDPIIKTLFDFQEAIRGVQQAGWFTRIKDDLIGIGTAFRDTFGGFKEFFGPVFEALGKIVEDWVKSFALIFGGGKKDLEGFFKTFDDGLVSIQNFIKTNETLKAVMDGIKDTVKIISDFAVNFLSISQAIEAYREAGGGLAGVFAVINDKIQAVLGLVGRLIERFTGWDLSDVGDGIMLVIQVIEEAFVRLADKIAQLFGWEDNPFHQLLETSESSFGKLQEIFNKFSGADVSGISALGEKLKSAFAPVEGLLGGFGKLLYGAWTVVQAVIPMIGEGLGWLGDILVSFSEQLKGMSFGDLLDIIKIILTFVTIKKVTDLLGGVSEIFDKIADSLRTWQMKLRAEALQALGAAILMIAGALGIISLIPTDKLVTSLGALAITLALLTASITMISSGLTALFSASAAADVKAIGSFVAVLIAFGKAMLDVAVAAGIMTVAIKSLADTSGAWEAIGQLGSVLGGITASLILLSRFTAAGRLAEAGTAILEISAALGVLAIVLKMFSGLDDVWESVGKLMLAFGSVAVITAGMVALVNLASRLGHGDADLAKIGLGVLEMAAALGVLVAVMKLLEGVSFVDLLFSLGKLFTMFVGFGVTALAVNVFGKAIESFVTMLDKLGSALLKIGIGVAVIGLISKILGDSAEELANAAVDLLVTVMDAIVARTDEIVEDLMQFIIAVLRGLADHTPEIVALCVTIIGEIVQGVRDALSQGDINGMDFAIGTGIIGGLIGLVIFLKKIKLTIADFTKAALVLAGAAVLLVEIGALFAGIGWLNQKIGGTEAINEFGAFAEAVAKALMGSNGGVLLLFLSLMGLELLFGQFGDLKDGAKDSWKAFGIVASVILEVTALMDELGLLFAATGGLITFINSLIGEHGKYTDAEGNEYTGTIAWIKRAGDFFSAIADVFREDGGIAIMFGAFVALEAVLAKFKVGAGAAGATWGAFTTIISVLTEATLLMDALGVLFTATGGLVQLLDFVVSLNGSFDNSVVGWIEKAGDFFESISIAISKFFGGFVSGAIQGVSKDVTEDMVSMVQAMSEVLLTLSESSILANISMFTGGPIGLAALGGELAGMAEGFVGFSEKVKDMPSDLVEKAAIAAGALAALTEAVPKTGGVLEWIMGEQDIGVFGERLAKFGEGLKNFNDAIRGEDGGYGLDNELISQASIAADTVISMAKKVPSQYGFIDFILGVKDIGEFGRRLKPFGEGLRDYSKAIVDLDTGAVEHTKTAVNTIIAMAKKVPNQSDSWYSVLLRGDTSMQTFGANLEAFGMSFAIYSTYMAAVNTDALDGTETAIESIIDVAKAVDKLGNVKDIKTFGNNLEEFSKKFKAYYDKVSLMDSQKLHLITAEIANTISGFSAADNDIVGKIQKFGNDVIDAIVALVDDKGREKKIKDAAKKVMDYVGEKFLEQKSYLSEKFQNAIEGALNDQTIETKMSQAGLDLMTKFRDGLTEGAEGSGDRESIKTVFEKILNDLIEAIDGPGGSGSQVGNAKKFYDAGVKLITSFSNGLTFDGKIGNTDSPVAKMKAAFKDTVINIVSLITGSDVTSQFTDAGSSLVNAIVSGIKSVDVTTVMTSIGNNASKGFAKGIEEGEGAKAAVKAAENLATTAANATANKLEVKSPSRLMMLIGQYFDEGFAAGIFDNIPMVNDAVTSLIAAVKDGIGGQSLIDMIKNSGFNISDTFGASIMEATDDMGNYGDMLSSAFLDGTFSNLTENVGADFFTEILNGMGYSLPDTTALIEEYGVDIGEAGIGGISEWLNADVGEELLSSTVLDGMSSALPTISSQSYQYGYEVGEAWGEGYNDEMLEIEDTYANLEIQGPTVTFVADTSQVKEALDEFVTYYGQKFAKNGELDGYLLAFDMADEAGKRAMIEQAQYEWANDELANTLRLRQIQADELLMQDAYWQNMASTLNASNASLSGEYESDYVTKEDLIEATTGMKEEIEGLRSDNQNMMLKLVNANVYLDSGELVGALAPGLDRQFGNLQKLGGRGI